MAIDSVLCLPRRSRWRRRVPRSLPSACPVKCFCSPISLGSSVVCHLSVPPAPRPAQQDRGQSSIFELFPYAIIDISTIDVPGQYRMFSTIRIYFGLILVRFRSIQEKIFLNNSLFGLSLNQSIFKYFNASPNRKSFF